MTRKLKQKRGLNSPLLYVNYLYVLSLKLCLKKLFINKTMFIKKPKKLKLKTKILLNKLNIKIKTIIYV